MPEPRDLRRCRVLFVARFAVLFIAFCAATFATRPALAVDLSRDQRVEVLLAAQRAFDRASAVQRSRPAEATAAFREAAGQFQLLVDSGVRNGRLYYNLGNAYLQLGDVGRAILNYRRAERLTPGDQPLAWNLGVARELRRNRIAISGERALLRKIMFWHYQWPTRIRMTLAVGLYGLFWILLILRVFVGRVRWRYAAAACLVLWVVLGSSVAHDLWIAPRHREGVVTTDDVVTRKGNGEGFEPQFNEQLHQGVEFRLRERRGDWLHIELPDGKSGWIRTEQAELI